MLLQMAKFHCMQITTFALSSHLQMATYFLILTIVNDECCNEHGYIHHLVVFLSFLGKYTEMELLDQIVVIFLI